MIVGIGLGVLMAAGLSMTLRDQERATFKAEAIKRNAAEWVVDPATGSTTFKWKEVAEKP